MQEIIRNNVYFSNSFTKQLLDSLDIGVHILDANGITLLYNRACEEIEGMNSRWIVGSDMKELVNEGVYSESIGLEVIRKKERVAKSQRVNDKYIHSIGIPIFIKGKLEKVVINVVDMTSKKKLQERLEKLEKINMEILDELNSIKDNNKDMVFKSKVMEEIRDLILRIFHVDSNILIEGESGVGKGVVSRFIHENSDRRQGPFVKVDCGSLAASLIESELFGYEAGFFTGARKEGKIGLIESSHNGTLFLDEIGELPLNLQVKLLSVIQDKKLQRIGGLENIDINTRIIAATNRDLIEMVNEGNFRMDLYYRLKVIDIKVPALRERREDIIPLIHLFTNNINKKYGFNKYFSPEAMDILISYHWPGNVREIENEVERLIVTSSWNLIKEEDVLVGSIGKYHNCMADDKKSFRENIFEYEKVLLEKYILKARDIHDLSKMTGMENSSLRKKAKRLNIELNYGGK